MKMDELEDKIKYLKNSFKGKTCFILATGPSLLDYDQNYLKTIFKKIINNYVKWIIFKKQMKIIKDDIGVSMSYYISISLRNKWK